MENNSNTISGGHGCVASVGYSSINGNSSTVIGSQAIGTTAGYGSVSSGVYYGAQPNPAAPKRPISIVPQSLGYLVTIGCQTVAVESVERLIEKLSEYLKNPQEAENLWNKDGGQTFMNESRSECACKKKK